MHRILKSLILSCLIFASIVVVSYAQDKTESSKPSKAQTTDALSGKPIDRNIYTDYNGKRIYFCCDNSRRDFLSDPERYFQALRSKGVELEQLKTTDSTTDKLIVEKGSTKASDTAKGLTKPLKAQMTDALSGKPVDRNVYVDYQGQRIYFCCANSRSDFQLNPDKYLKVFREQGVTLEKSPESK